MKLKARGVSGKLLDWIKSYLCGRKIQVVVGGQSSLQKDINASVPQGSLLGPTMFLVYIDDLGDNLNNTIFLYADDSTLYCIIHQGGLYQSAASLNADLAQIHHWGSEWRVIFAPEKCKVMTISMKRPQNQPLPEPPLSLGGTELEECTELDILGVTFTRNMSFDKHIDKLASKAGSRVSMLRRVAPYLDTRGKGAVYRAHIRSVMEYAPLSWMSASVTQLRRLEDIQRRACKIIGSNHRLDSLEHRRLISGLGLLHRLHRPDQPQVLKSLLPPRACPSRTTRATGNTHALQPLAGRTSTGHWSLQQYDRSALPTVVPVWNSLPASIIGTPTLEDSKTFCRRVYHHLK